MDLIPELRAVPMFNKFYHLMIRYVVILSMAAGYIWLSGDEYCALVTQRYIYDLFIFCIVCFDTTAVGNQFLGIALVRFFNYTEPLVRHMVMRNSALGAYRRGDWE